LVSVIPENMEPLNQTGFNFENGSVSDLEEKLKYLLSNEEIVREEGINSQRIAEDKFNWNNIVNKTEDLYKNLILKK